MEKEEIKRIIKSSGYLNNNNVCVEMYFEEDLLVIITKDLIQSRLAYRKIEEVECGGECCFFRLTGNIKVFVGNSSISIQ